ncbi:hypothetical protein J6590_050658 [Homalodisca vitripennis]|nr:hypothetical protein J6590_050658 [Homalodisca vitripennis]
MPLIARSCLVWSNVADVADAGHKMTTSCLTTPQHKFLPHPSLTRQSYCSSPPITRPTYRLGCSKLPSRHISPDFIVQV